MLTVGKRERLRCKRAELCERLAEYRQQEHNMLMGLDISHTIGSRRLERYPMSIDQIRRAIEELEKQLDEIDALLNGGHARKSVAYIPRDW